MNVYIVIYTHPGGDISVTAHSTEGKAWGYVNALKADYPDEFDEDDPQSFCDVETCELDNYRREAPDRGRGPHSMCGPCHVQHTKGQIYEYRRISRPRLARDRLPTARLPLWFPTPLPAADLAGVSRGTRVSVHDPDE